MKVSLNKANKLRNALEKIDIEFPGHVEISAGESSSDAGGKLNSAKTEFGAKWKLLQELTKGIGLLRTLIHDHNRKTGVSDLMGEIATINRTIREVGQLNHISRGGSSWEEFKAYCKYFQELTEKSDTPPQPRKQSVQIVDEGMSKEIDDFIADQKLQLEDLVEKRNAINSSNYIELPKDLVELLREFRLVK